jgi:ADP-dependent NAD(P)H-hydrate dehydratase / NAD(P)H-hydrate epimerase
MKILTAAEMRLVDRRTIEAGIPGLILMESAASRTVDVMVDRFAPLASHSILVVCGKGNNGGDGFAIARQLFTRRLFQDISVVHLFPVETLQGEAKENFQMLLASGCPVREGLPEVSFPATLIVDSILGTGLDGSARGPALDAIRLINGAFSRARKIAVDIPSGLSSDEPVAHGEFVHAEATVTFTAPKLSQCLSPSYEWMGDLIVAPIGTPDSLCESADEFRIRLTTPADISPLFRPRARDSNKGRYGHVLIVAGSSTKPGAAAMAALTAYRSGAGLVTVASAKSAISSISAFAPELMTEPLPETEGGSISMDALGIIRQLLDKKTVLAIGPGLGAESETVELVRRLYDDVELPMVVDADALNALAGHLPLAAKPRILTPHPGEMGRLVGLTPADVQKDRLGLAGSFSARSNTALLLKGDRTVLCFPQSDSFEHPGVWINPTGSPAMSTGGTGDILTGTIAGLIAQHPDQLERATVAAAWLHGRSGEFAARKYGEQSTVATDLLEFYPEAMNELRAAL